MDQKLRADSIYRVFAENLREQCNRYGSIAAFCRASGINRQQFNRYLSAQNLPNPHNLQRICTTLQVSEASLFATPGTTLGLSPFLDGAGLQFLAELTHGLSPHSYETLLQTAKLAQRASVRSRIQPGTYLAYSPFAGAADMVVCSAVKVTVFGNLMAFTRHTSFRLPGSNPRSFTVGRHVGIVLSDAIATKFIGVNSNHPHELSVMHVLHSATGPGALRVGLSMFHTQYGDIACRTVMSFVGSDFAAQRKALGMIGAWPAKEPDVPANVLDLLSAPSPFGATNNMIDIRGVQLDARHVKDLAKGPS